MMTDLGQTMLGEMLDGTVAWFFGTAVWILIEALIGLPVIGLRIVHRPGTDLILVDPHLGVSDPGRETIEPAYLTDCLLRGPIRSLWRCVLVAAGST
jgi:hypothetical protein